MHTKRIIYSLPDGGVAIIMPAVDSGMTLEQIAAKDVPEGVPFEIVDAASIPEDRTFRAAWKRDGRKVAHDMPKVRDLAHARRREVRAAEFAPLDAEATIPGKLAQVETKRQAVRDRHAALQKQIDRAASPDEVRAVLDRL